MRMTYERDCRLWLLFVLSAAVSLTANSLVDAHRAQRRLSHETILAVGEAAARERRATLLDWSSAPTTYRWQVGTATSTDLLINRAATTSTRDLAFQVGGAEVLAITAAPHTALSLGVGAPHVVCQWPQYTQACKAGTQTALSTILYADGTWTCRIACEAKR